MKKDILLIKPNLPADAWAESYISFSTFTLFLQNKIATGTGIKIKYFQYVLDKILAYPELQGDMRIQDIHQYEDILELVSSIAFPIMEDENEYLWAFGSVLTPEIFYGSNAFYNLLSSKSEWYAGDAYLTQSESSEMVKELHYELILQKLYNYNTDQRKEWIHGFVHSATGLYQYYRINMDRRFATLKIKTALPDIGIAAIESCLACTAGRQQLEDILPMKNLLANGFNIVTLTNVTATQALEHISKEVAGFDINNSLTDFNQITLLLQTIAGNRHYRFGLMPLFTINGRAALLYENFPFSIIVKTCLEQGVPKKIFDNFMKIFLKKPVQLTYSPLTKSEVLPDSIQQAFKSAGLPFYSLEPVYAGAKLVGIFEVSTDKTDIPNDNHLGDSLRPAMPFMAQLLHNFVDKFNTSINAIIKDQFTNIQSAVQWKFNEAAWHYFRNHLVEGKAGPVEDITFENVFPLYGAIDIRDSTIERNKALRSDLLVQLNHLRDILQTIENTGLPASCKKMVVACDHWLYQLQDYITIEQELELNDFLIQEISPFLQAFQHNETNLVNEKIQRYQETIDEDNGAAFVERRQLESSIGMINSAVGQYLDLLQVELQGTYPCYFEKIRTDGAEYDIYMGQSIAPKIAFKMSHLQKTRLIQLKAMAAITKLTNALLPQLPHALHTTQLIFVHSRSIDVSFRKDERRFDVEGAYNIRYHIIKKRIDKVRIRDTGERLTKVGKIAIVYYNEKDAAEYETYIRQLQQEHILANDLEYLELEELQGVSGLKALRVGVGLG